MTDNPEPGKEPESRRTPADWSQPLENLSETIAQWMNQVGIGANADLQTASFTEPIGGAGRGAIRLDLTVGRVSIRALPPTSDNLIEVDVTSIGAVEMVAVTEGETKSVRLRQKRSTTEDIFKPVRDAVDTVARSTELAWDIRLSPRVPLTLVAHAELTLDIFDLTGLQVPRLEYDGGTGKTDITFPAGTFNAVVDGGLGILNLTVPDEARASLDLNIGAGTTFIRVGEASVKADIQGGVGNCEIEVNPGTALRVRGESGLGNIDVPEAARPVQFESEFISESGEWQTSGYEFASNKVDVRYEGGVGSLVIRERDTR